MPQTPYLSGGDVETLIFVDVDGVLNIGIEDPGKPPLEFSTFNAERAIAKRDAHECNDVIDRIVSTYTHELGHGESSTYAKFVSAPETSLSDVLVERLAQIICAAGKRRRVVLTSTWRWPKHTVRVWRLELAVSQHLGRPFFFDAKTALCEDLTAESRLNCIADFAEQHCQDKLGAEDKLRILVLEDFHITPLGSWYCGKDRMDSEEAVERYLRSRVPIDASVKLIHTFDEWKVPTGLQVRVGAGLTKEKLCRALSFLGGTCDHCAVSSVRAEMANACQQPAGMAKSTWLKLSDFMVAVGMRIILCLG